MSRLTQILAPVLLLSLSCGQQWEPPPPDLKERNRAVMEVAKQKEAIEKGGLEAALPNLSHDDDRVRRAAILEIAKHPKEAVAHVPALIAALSDEVPSVQTAAARTLAAIGDDRAIEPLIEAMMSNDEEVRLWCWKSLVGMREPAYEKMIYYLGKEAPTLPRYKGADGKSIHVRIHLREVMPQLGRRIVPALSKCLADQDPFRNLNCARVLREIGDDARDSVPDLVAQLEGSSYEDLRIQCIYNLEQLGDVDPTIVPALKKATLDRSKKVAKRAERALKTIERRAAKEQRKKDEAQKKRKAKHKSKNKKKLPPKPAMPEN